MSTENLKEESDKERQRIIELEQQLKEKSTSENNLQIENDRLRKEVADLKRGPNEKMNIQRSPLSPTAIESGGNKRKGEAITDLHFSQPSPSGSVNSHGPNQSGSSSSFEVIERSSPLYLQRQRNVPNSSSDPDSKISQLAPLKSSEQMTARVPEQSSVHHDSRLTLCPARIEASSPVLDKVNFSHHNVTKSEGIHQKGDLCEAYSSPEQSALQNNMGARPKNNNSPNSNPRKEDCEKNPESETQSCQSENESKEVQNSKMLVQIPKDEGTFRINHLPLFNYARDISLTGISSIFTNSEGEIHATPKHNEAETEILQLNDLNSESSRCSDKSLPPKMEPFKKGSIDEILDLPPRIKDPQEQEPFLMSFASPMESIDTRNIVCQPQMTSEDNIDLAQQLSDLVMEMKSNVFNTEEFLGRFAKIAEEVAKLESRLKEHQAQIQKLQVHSSSLQDHSAEVLRLQQENEELRQLIQIPVQQLDVRAPVREPGWVTVTANETEPKQEDKALKEELKKANALNDKLFNVNKQWEESWNQRENLFAAEKEELNSKLQQFMMKNEMLMKENMQLKEETATVSQLTNELKTLKHGKHELEQQVKVQESHLLKELKMNSQIKAKLGGYNNPRGDMETKVRDLSGKIDELKTENVVLKEQLTVTMEDYKKEKKDRTIYEDLVKKLRLEKSDLKKVHDAKIKSANAMIKKRESEILNRDKTIEGLQKTIGTLTAKLRTSERRTVLQPPSMFQSGQPSDVFYPSASPAYNPTQMKLLTQQLSENPGEILVSQVPGLNDGRYQAATSAEHSPESWACPNCTFINFPFQKNCEICGSAKLSDDSSLSSFTTLHSRDEWPGRDVRDTSEQINVT